MFGIEDEALNTLLGKLIESVRDKPQSMRVAVAIDFLKQLETRVTPGSRRLLDPRLKLVHDSETNQQAKAILKTLIDPKLLVGIPREFDFGAVVKAFIYLNFPRFITEYHRAQGEEASLKGLKILALDKIVANREKCLLALNLCDHRVTRKHLERHRAQAPMSLSPDAVSLYGDSEDLLNAIKPLFPEAEVRYSQDESQGSVASIFLTFFGDYSDVDDLAVLFRATLTTLMQHGVKVDADFPDLLEFILVLSDRDDRDEAVYQSLCSAIEADPTLRARLEKGLTPSCDMALIEQAYSSKFVQSWLQKTDGDESLRLFAGKKGMPRPQPVVPGEDVDTAVTLVP